jgi:hypothetical protein
MAEAKVVCACCERAIPDGHIISRLRLTAEDIQGQESPRDRKPGLRGHCCENCLNIYLPIIAKRLGVQVEDMPAHGTF